MVLCLMSAGGAAADTSGPDATSLWIEAIAIEGLAHASPEMIVAESQLTDGRAYAESDLRDALHRIRRLPFVRDAELALRRGGERGRYVLVIDVVETRRFFFGEDLIVTRASPGLALARGRPREGSVRTAPQAGARHFVGRYGVLFGSIGGAVGAQVGYQRYNPFGRGGVFGVAVQGAGCCATRIQDLGLDPTFSVWRERSGAYQLDIDLGLPLRGPHALEVHYTQRRSEDGRRRAGLVDDATLARGHDAEFAFDDLRRQRLEIAWRRDTTDDPIFPRRGSWMRAGLDATALDADQTATVVTFEGREVGPPTALPTGRSRQLRLVLQAEKTWAVGRAHALSFGVRGSVGRAQIERLAVDATVVDGVTAAVLATDERPDVWSAGLHAQYSISLLSATQTRRLGELYWQNRLSWDLEGTSLAVTSVPDGRFETIKLETSIGFRTAWGLFRLSFQLLELST